MKVLSDKDFTQEDRNRIESRKKKRTCPYMMAVGRRRMKEISDGKNAPRC